MPVLPVSHFTWQVLRTVHRSKNPLSGRALRLVPNRRTKDGTFLTELVDLGLMTLVSGTANEPFEATYALTERGQYAAEYGEGEIPARVRATEPTAVKRSKPAPKGHSSGRASK